MFATQLRDAPGLGIYFASYEFLARRMSKDGTVSLFYLTRCHNYLF